MVYAEREKAKQMGIIGNSGNFPGKQFLCDVGEFYVDKKKRNKNKTDHHFRKKKYENVSKIFCFSYIFSRT